MKTTEIEKSRPVGERRIPAVGRKQRARRGIDRCDGEGRGRAARRAEHPRDISGDGQPPRAVRRVADRQARDPDRVGARHVFEQIELEVRYGMPEAAIAPAMARDIGAAWVTDRRRGRAEQRAAVVVADVEGMTAGILYGIVRPWRQRVFAAVRSPGEAGTVGRDLETEPSVGDDVYPRHRRRLSGAERHDILPAVVGEATQAIEKLMPRLARHGRGVNDRVVASTGQSPWQGRFAARIELACEAAVLRVEDYPRHRQKQRTRCVGDEVGAQHISSATGAFAELRARLAGADEAFERVLKVLNVRRAALVDDDQIESEALHSPIVGCLDQITGDPEMFDIGDAQHDDRQVPGDPERPEPRLRAGSRGDRF